MPDWSTFFNRCCRTPKRGSGEAAQAEKLFDLYTLAHESWAMSRVHQVADISDHTEEGIEVTESEGPKGTTTSTKRSDMLGHRQLKMKSRTWFAEQVLQRYAPKTTLQNPDGSPIMRPVINMTILPEPKEK